MRRLIQLTSLLLICLGTSIDNISAQSQLSIKNFSVFGGDNTASTVDSTASGVEFASNISLTGGGLVGTQTYFLAGQQVNISGNVYCNLANIGNSFTINPGSIFVYNQQSRNYDVLAVGGLSQFLFPGNITANGNVNINTNGSVDGVAHVPTPPYQYIGPSPDLGLDSSTILVFPTMPVLPPATTFPAAGATNITTAQTIIPGSYGTIALTTNVPLTFKGTGTYVFNSIANLNQDTFKFDFQNNTTGSFKIYVYGNVDLGNIQTLILNGGSASRIYLETHGSGSPAFAMNTTNGFSGIWAGTVYAPNGSIQVGNVNFGSVNAITGCLWSPKKVTVGRNTSFAFAPLSITADPTPNPDIKSHGPSPADGKINTAAGAELTVLFDNKNSILRDSIIYQIFGSKVLLDVIPVQGQNTATLTYLQSFGLTNIINNGSSNIITGQFPIDNIPVLNTRPDLVRYARPEYFAITSAGLVTSQGDTAMRSNLVKYGYNLSGQGVKVGVISDSYNTLETSPGVLANYAAVDVANGDLPSNVDVVGEYPFGPRTDEGRAMLQIVHDVAPNAQLAFRTGFVTPGDFAQGIGQLAAAGCKVIVDDVTYITEPYYTDGIVAQAVDNAVANGVTYFSAAGNFGKSSYESSFSETVAPAAISALTGPATRVHNFATDGTSNPYQTLNLTPGSYTLVLQWEDDIYSLGAPTSGTQTDLDIFLVDNAGGLLFGFNRDNRNGDPIEVLPFDVSGATTANLVIAKAAGPNVGIRFKYIVFRGDLSIAGYAGSSTLVGQANASGAIAVGAVLYKNTPAYNVNPPTIASFSSIGGARVNGTTRFKPELTAPNGVNTTVDFHNPNNLEGDRFPNFFGTSAAAPHAAAAAALLIEGEQKYLGQTITPTNLRTLLQNTAIDMNAPGYPAGYDPINGYGFINPFGAMQTFANPIPLIDSLVTPAPLTRPVTAPFTVTVKGKGLNPGTVVYLRGSPIGTTFVDNQTVTAVIPAFNDNPPIQLFNPSIVNPAVSNGNVDGGLSESSYFFSTTQKHIVVTAVDKTKKYGEKIPAFTSTITVDGVLIQNTTLTPADLKLDRLTYTTTATTSSNVTNYPITPVNPLNPALPADALLLTQYSYEFIPGVLTIDKLPLRITPRDTTLIYGQRIRGINFNYQVTPSNNIQNPDSLLNSIHLTHANLIIDSILALANGSGASSRALVNGDLTNLSIMISSGSGASSRALVNNGNGTTETSHIVDVADTSIFNYLRDPARGPLTNGSGASSRALVNTGPLINGTATIIVNGSGASSRALVNGNPVLLNSTTTGGSSNTNVAVIISYPDVPSSTNTITITKSVNMVTNGINIGTHTIVPGAFISSNFEITYGLGKLTINKAPLTITANTKYTDNGVLPAFTSTITGYQYQDASIPKSGPVYTLVPGYTGQGGVYSIKPASLVFPGDSNYAKYYVNGNLYVNPYNTGKKILIAVRCVEKIKNNPAGFGYVAHFTAQNNNATPYYVPLGSNNFLAALGKYSGAPPVLFPKGTTYFDIFFDGKLLTWTLVTYEKKSKCFQVAIASSLSCNCTNTNTIAYRPVDDIVQNSLPGKMGIYPNPATNKLVVTSDKEFGSEKNVIVLDVYGRVINVKARIKSARIIELNISTLPKGTYFIRIKEEAKNKTVSFIKL